MGGSLVPIPKSTREKQTLFTGLSLSCHLKKQFPRSTEKGKKRRSWSSLTSYLPQQPYLQHLQVIGQLFENFQGLKGLVWILKSLYKLWTWWVSILIHHRKCMCLSDFSDGLLQVNYWTQLFKIRQKNHIFHMKHRDDQEPKMCPKSNPNAGYIFRIISLLIIILIFFWLCDWDTPETKCLQKLPTHFSMFWSDF